jgi:hypothetical protein
VILRVQRFAPIAKLNLKKIAAHCHGGAVAQSIGLQLPILGIGDCRSVPLAGSATYSGFCLSFEFSFCGSFLAWG